MNFFFYKVIFLLHKLFRGLFIHHRLKPTDLWGLNNYVHFAIQVFYQEPVNIWIEAKANENQTPLHVMEKKSRTENKGSENKWLVRTKHNYNQIESDLMGFTYSVYLDLILVKIVLSLFWKTQIKLYLIFLDLIKQKSCHYVPF